MTYNWDTSVTGGITFTSVDDTTINAHTQINHTATETGDHTLELNSNAMAFGDVRALDIKHSVGAISGAVDEECILINIDEDASTGGRIVGLEILSTETGSAIVDAIEIGAGIHPILHQAGIFVAAGDVDNDGADVTAALAGSDANITMFVSNGDTFTVGDAAKFSEMEFILDINATNPGVRPIFAFSIGGTSFTNFTPTDGTNGLRNSGIVLWNLDDIPGWVINTSTNFEIRMTRDTGASITSPRADKLRISATTEFLWDKDGKITIDAMDVTNNVTIGGNLDVSGTTTTTEVNSLLVENNFMHANTGLIVPGFITGGATVRINVTADTDTIGGSGFAAGDTITTTTGNVFSPGDIITVDESNDVDNNGYYEVTSHTGTTLVINGTSTLAFVKLAFTADVGDTTAVFNKAVLAVIRADTNGNWEVATGSIESSFTPYVKLISSSTVTSTDNRVALYTGTSGRLVEQAPNLIVTVNGTDSTTDDVSNIGLLNLEARDGGTNSISLAAADATAAWQLTFPAAAPAVGQVITATSTGGLTNWQTASGGGGGAKNYEASDFLNVTESGWDVTVLAPTIVDPTEPMVNVRAFDGATDEAVGFQFFVPLATTNLEITLIWRKSSAVSGTVLWDLHSRIIDVGGAIDAAVWDTTPNEISSNDPGTNEFIVKTTATIALSATDNIEAGQLGYFQLVRDASADTYNADCYVLNLTVGTT